MRNLLAALGIGIALGFAAAAAGANPSVRIDDASVERMGGGRVVVRWKSVPEGAPVDVAIARPDARGTKLLSDDDRDGRHELSSEVMAHRPLVHLTTAAGVTFVTAERVLPLQGGRNFRDLGGYRTDDGHSVKWGKVFRSGTMANLTDADYELLSTMGIRVVCDFRSTDERQREPTDWRTRGPKPEYQARDYALESNLRTVLGQGKPTAEGVKAAMTSFYGELPYTHADNYRKMFKSLAAGEAPLAFNCSAGKDRTGLGAALLLTMLGVPRETVVDDYALSERVVNYETEFVAKGQTVGLTKPSSSDALARFPVEVRGPLLRSDPDYIRAALSTIEQREGSIDAYFEKVLNVTKDEQATIRKLLLERI